MTEPTLYQLDREVLDFENWMPDGDAKEVIEEAVECGVLVPVERCEHGYLDPHHWYESGDTHEPTACPGAGIGDNDES